MVEQKRYDRMLTVGAVKTGLMLARASDGSPLWEVAPAPSLAPAYNPGQASYLNYSPTDDLVFEENDWRKGLVSGGFGGDSRFKNRLFASPKVYATTGDAGFDGVAYDMAVFKSNLYLAAYNGVYRYNTSTSNWDKVLTETAHPVCLGILGDDYILVGWGSADKYHYSSSGDSNNWAQSTLADGYADHFASVVASGGETLWKALGREIKSSTNPSNSGAWTGATNIGWSTTNITDLLGYREALHVFKEEGPYIYDGTNWVPVSRELESLLGSNSGKNAWGWKNKVYFQMGENAVYHYTPSSGAIDTITPSMYAPSEATFRGRSMAFAADEEYLFNFLDNASVVELLAGRWEEIDGATDFWWHRLLTFAYSDVKCALVTSVVANKRLWFADGASDPPSYIILPDKYGDVPSATGYKFSTGWIHYTPEYTGFFLDIPKVWLSLVLKTSGLLAGTRTVLAEYSADGGAWTTIGTFDTSPLQTKYIGTEGVEAKEIRLRFTGTNGEDTTLIIEGFALHGLLRPLAKREFRFSVRVADNLQLRAGLGPDKSQTAKSISTALRAAYRTLPVGLEDEWGVSHKVVLLSPPHEISTLDEAGRVQEQIFSIVARETTLA